MKMPRLGWLVATGAALLIATASLAPAQTAPATFCGYPHVRNVSTDIVDSGAGYASQSVGNSAASAAPTPPVLKAGIGPILGAILYIDQNAIRFRTDGTTVSGTFDGNIATAGSVWQVCGSEVNRWSAIASSTGSNAILRWNWQTTGG